MIYKSLLKYWWSFPKDDSKVKLLYIAIDDFSQFLLLAKLLKETASMALRIEAVAFQWANLQGTIPSPEANVEPNDKEPFTWKCPLPTSSNHQVSGHMS